MALLPTVKRITREEIKDAPDWIQRLLVPINTFFDAIYNALAHNLTFSENFLSQEKVLMFRTKSTYYAGDFDQISFPKSIGKKVSGVFLMQIKKEASYYTPILNGVFVDWTEINGNVVIGYVTGLEALTSYTLRVLVI